MNANKTEIQCPYCDSVWDYNAYDKCPYCGAAPDMEQIDKAHKRETQQIKQQTEAEAIKNPGKALSTWVASKLPLWLALLAILFVGPLVLFGVVSCVPKQKPSVDLQVVDEPEIVKHSPGTDFNITDYLSVNVSQPDALLLKESSISTLIPEDYAALLIKVSAKGDGESHSIYSLKKNETARLFGVPYIIADNVAYTPVASHYFRDLNISEPELKNLTNIEPGYSITAQSGYLCYIVPKDVTDCTIFFEDVHYTKLVRYLDCIHAVELTVKEAE